MYSPKSVLLVHVHEQNPRQTGHALTVAHFRIVHGVGGQNIKQHLLLDAVTFSVVQMFPTITNQNTVKRFFFLGVLKLPKLPIDVRINLTCVRWVFPRQLHHFLILSLVHFFHFFHLQQFAPGVAAQGIWNAFIHPGVQFFLHNC